MSKVEYIQTASPQKLPYLHSKFKPSTKFAKSFDGCSRFSKQKQYLSQNEAHFTRLPRITYNAQDFRETPPAFGSDRRGTRREYPGFTGQTRILRNKSNRKSQTTSDAHLLHTSPREPKESMTHLSNDSIARDYIPENDWSKNEHSARRRRDLRLSNQISKPGHTKPISSIGRKESDVNTNTNGLISDMDSLFIYDDDQEANVEVDHEGQKVSENFKAINKVNEDDSPHRDTKVRFSGNTLTVSDDTSDDEDAMQDPFAKNFEEKLRGIRGKSGMKRNRTKKRLQRKRSDVDMRPLGDVITSKRLQELLSPQNAQGVTIRLHS
ncbi:hypothetical protein PoB_005786300 [Plakobranchus ocellatus]|uniref:Uncharacterized protein n=1 Tax=Plakobranchus ocellatus TaxID=259542 RepID=A0AAV4CHE1_9GAST|nr:hypothetical protein PoB_005786300 [Plakobranchus ocellatus]